MSFAIRELKRELKGVVRERKNSRERESAKAFPHVDAFKIKSLPVLIKFKQIFDVPFQSKIKTISSDGRIFFCFINLEEYLWMKRHSGIPSRWLQKCTRQRQWEWKYYFEMRCMSRISTIEKRIIWELFRMRFSIKTRTKARACYFSGLSVRNGLCGPSFGRLKWEWQQLLLVGSKMKMLLRSCLE